MRLTVYTDRMVNKLNRGSLPWMILLFSLTASLTPFTSLAQYFTIGTDPASVRWNKIKTDHFTVIFPDDFEDKAQHMANGLEYFYGPGHQSLNAAPRRFPVILHNRSVASNAFVPYAPRRIEILTVAPQDHYSTEWLDDLILHEFRHTVHYASVDRGLTHGLSYLFGQQITAGVLGLFVPLWFIEGDATVTETAFSLSGRGRVPSFEQKLRAQFLEKGIYHYDKASHGSFRDFIPNRYELGYQLVGRTRAEFGTEAWASALRKAGTLPIMVVPFSHALKKHTGYGKVQLFRHITEEMKEEWEETDRQLKPSGFEAMTPKPAVYTDYTHPYRLSSGEIIAMKSSLNDIYRIVIIGQDGKVGKLATPGTRFQPYALSASDSLVCWGEHVPDPRWDLRDYAVIKTYELATGKTRQLTHRSRLFAPAITRQGDRIVAVKVSIDNRYSMVIVDAENGSILDSLSLPGNLFFQQPAWSEDGSRIVSVVRGDRGKSMVMWEPGRDSISFLLPFTHTEISSPSFFKGHILYTGAYTGMDNIFALHIPSGDVFRVTTARFGATDAAPDLHSDSILYADYTSDGYRIVRTVFDPTRREPQDPSLAPSYPLAEALAEQEGLIYTKDSIPADTFEVKRYRRGLNLFNFHSWAPLNFETDNQDVKPGVTLLSQNLLSTSFTTLGWEYDLNEQAGKFSFSYRYEGLYPVFDVGLDYGLRRGVFADKNDTIKFKYNELNVYLGTSVPLSWSVNSWYMGLTPRVSGSFKYLTMDPEFDLEFNHDRILAAYYSLFFYAQQKRSYRDLQPRWGQSVQVGFNHSLLDSTLTANSMFYSVGVFYLPGLLRHHGLRIYLGYYDRLVDYYRFSNPILTPRGQTGIYADRMATLSASYVFPIFYPDWRLGPVFYLKRLKANLFYDHSIVLDESPFDFYNTVGLDLTVDFHFLSILAPLEVGLRAMYFPQDGTFSFAPVWSLNIDSLY